MITKFLHTLPESNVAPENRPLEKEIPIGNHHSSGARLVSGRVMLTDTFERFFLGDPIFSLAGS